MCGWPVAMRGAQQHWSTLSEWRAAGQLLWGAAVRATKVERKEQLNINHAVSFQGPGSRRGQWTEGLHVDLRHRLPSGGSLLWVFLYLSWGAGREACRIWPQEVLDQIWSQLSVRQTLWKEDIAAPDTITIESRLGSLLLEVTSMFAVTSYKLLSPFYIF